MKWIIIAAVALFGVAAVALFVAIQNPTFVSRLVAAAASMLAAALLPVILKRKSPEAEAADRASYRRGEDKTPGSHGHGGEH